MFPARPAPLTAAQRAGFWILCGTTFVQIGFPVFMLAAFDTHPRLLYGALILSFAFVSSLTHLGLIGTRILNILASLGFGGFCLFATLRMLAILGDHIGDHWPVFMIVPVLPGVAYTLCAVLLALPAVAQWQCAVRERIVWQMRTGEPPREFDPPANPDEPPTACYWCEAVVVRVGDQYCRACRRPIG